MASTPIVYRLQSQVLVRSTMSCALRLVPNTGVLIFDSLGGETAHDVDTELEAKGMHIVRQRLEPIPTYGRWEPIRGRDRPAELVQAHRGRPVSQVGVILRHLPAYVNDYVLPTVLVQACRHNTSVGFDLVLGHQATEAVVAVPPHRRRFSNPQTHFTVPFEYISITVAVC